MVDGASAGTSRAGSPRRSSARPSPAFATDVAAWVAEGAPTATGRPPGSPPRPPPSPPSRPSWHGSTQPTEPGAHAALGRLYADGDLVYTASSMPIRDQESFVAAGPAVGALPLQPRRERHRRAGLVRASAPPSASGRPTWIVTGDLGLFHDMNALATLRHAEAPVRIVVLNNDGGGIFEFLPQAGQVDRDEFEALLGTPVGLRARAGGRAVRPAPRAGHRPLAAGRADRRDGD